MLLYLMRHGIAADLDALPGTPDAQRPLTEEGVKKTQAVARALARLEIAPQVVLTSPLTRAVQTAEIVVAEVGGRRRTTPALTPGSPPDRLLAEVVKLGVDTVLCTGHAPHLDLVLACAVGAATPLTELKKAAVACLDLEPTTQRALLLWVLPPGLAKRLE